jgi:FAD/FMN-containing dehydrogenase/Fe-S oxidoreductase
MDERRARILDDLRGLIEGELLFDPIGRAPYALDASLYEIDPLGVVAPRHEDDLIALVRYARDESIAIHPRGAGTSLGGETLGEGIVVDFSRHFRRIVATGTDSVVVEPGVVLDILNAHLAPLGQRIGPDPSGPEARTLGGMIGVNAAGARSLRQGTTADHVRSLSVVFSSGDTARLAPEAWPDFEAEPADFHGSVARKVGTILRHHSELIGRNWPKSPRNRAGYALATAGNSEALDLSRLVVGSEGTLALVTEATLRTVPLAAAQSVAILPFARLADAAAAVDDCLAFTPTACELYDWRSISLARDAVPAAREWFTEPTEAALIVEFEAERARDSADLAQALLARVDRKGQLACAPSVANRRADCELIMGLRRIIRPLLNRMSGPSRPVAFIEDIAVPPSLLPTFLVRLQQILRQFEVSWTIFGHVGHGQLHVRPFLDLSDPADLAKLEPLASEVYAAAWDVGGSISGEHGCGLVRTQFLRRQYGDLVHAFQAVKAAFDPFGLLNPGKVVGDDPHLMTRNLRPFARAEPAPAVEKGDFASITLPVLEPMLRWEGTDPWREAGACNGCGACRTLEPSQRMCPAFRARRDEAASPRAQANLMRQIATGAIDPRLWGSEELKRNSDLCIHCTLCRSECPSAIDVSSLMIEAKAAYVQNHGLPLVDWLLSRVEQWSRLASRFPILSNALVRNRGARLLMERLVGFSRLRSLPRAHRTPFVRRAERLGLGRPRPQEPGPRVAYFVDVFANYFDQELAQAVVSVLREAGVNVFVPPRQRGSGMSALVAGDLDNARDLASINLRVLGDAVRDGYTIVCSEPTAALMLRQEYLRLTDDLDASLVAANTMDVGQYLAGLAARGGLPEPKIPLHARVGYHQPCHLRSLDVGTPGLDLIRTIPGLDVQFIDRGCSGMAGTFGLARRNFRTSLRAGRGLLRRLREDDIEIGATECGPCRMQMEQGIEKRTLHPVKLLSLSYGLNPRLQARFKEPKRRLDIS